LEDLIGCLIVVFEKTPCGKKTMSAPHEGRKNWHSGGGRKVATKY